MDKNKVETQLHVSKFHLIKRINQANWDEAAIVLFNDESYAQIHDENNNYPIHLGLYLGLSPKLLVLILTAFPECINIRDKDGSLPIHIAASHNKGKLWINLIELMRLLLKANPQCIAEKDKEGYLPLHIAIRCKAPDEVILLLLTSYPDGVKVPDKKGNLALHLAIQFDTPKSIIGDILRTYPEASKIINENKCFPLHKVAYFNSCVEVLELVLAANPAASFGKDIHGNLPLHLAFLIAGGPPDEFKLRLWLSSNPGSLSMKNKYGFTPLTMFNKPQSNLVDDYL